MDQDRYAATFRIFQEALTNVARHTKAGRVKASLRREDREIKLILCMIGSGKTVKEIAEELSLIVKTVSIYRSRILEKMEMRNNAELTHYAAKNQFLDK